MNSELSFEDKSTIYQSLVALVKAEYPFDDALQDRAVQILKNLTPMAYEPVYSAKLVTNLVPSSAGSPSGFVESILTLLSSPHSRVVVAALSFLHQTTLRSSNSIRYRLVESDLISHMLVILHPHTLSISGNETMLNKLVWNIILSLRLATRYYVGKLNITTALETHNHHEMIFQKVILPSSQFLTSLISNRNMLNGELCDSFMKLLTTHLHIGPFHLPTLEFVLASTILMAFSSCLSFIEDDHDIWSILIKIDGLLYDWKNEGPEVAQSGKQILQALFSEGFEDIVEQMLKHEKSGDNGSRLVEASHSISKLLGSNVPKW
ncbi:hypothetical protein BLNAU_5021 [Blattamonas nauphoetae]|uniref:Uncharacterized protein n=1 Tax=Blattamonas nauphoetae TaxID=2049346 RepID=A0ABQ9Y8R3_9EUKA|nr:hypothetical protein BLNAU_5021 [Blattamonas nauphoetae]